MRAPVSFHLEWQTTQGHHNTRTDVVPERHGADEVRAADAELLAGG